MTTESAFSSYVITDPCIGVKDGTCVEVWPVDCIATTEDDDQFFIDPALCIAREQCVLVCPVDAIYLEHEVPAEWKASIERNRDFFLEAKEDTPAVSVEWAEQLIRSALVRAGELGIDVSVVVVDQRGELVATSPASADEPTKGPTAAQATSDEPGKGPTAARATSDEPGKGPTAARATSDEPGKTQTAANRAYTAVGFALSTSQLNERSLERAPESLDRTRLVAGPGGIPIGRPYVVGAIGVAGGAAEQDEQCCRAAVTGVQGAGEGSAAR